MTDSFLESTKAKVVREHCTRYAISVLRLCAHTVNTRMHSSRMHTARLLPVSPSMHCSGGLPLVPGGVCLWSLGGCLPLVPWGVPASGPGGCLPLVPGDGGAHSSMHWGRHPPVDRMTDTCKNITFTNFICGR